MIDNKAFRSLSYGLYIISSKDGEQAAGCVVNTFQQVASTPPRVSVAINKDNYTAQVIKRSERFSVVCLAQNVAMELIGLFGFQSSRDVDKFADIPLEYDVNKIPYLCEQVVARFAITVIDSLDVGTHILFVGDVVEAEVLSDAEPMTYAYYHLIKGGKTPPKASSYQASEDVDTASDAVAGMGTTGRSAWRCKICGHIEERDELPEDFVCPICKKGREFFERVSC